MHTYMCGSVSILYYVNYRALQSIVVFMVITWSVGLDYDMSTFIALILNCSFLPMCAGLRNTWRHRENVSLLQRRLDMTNIKQNP